MRNNIFEILVGTFVLVCAICFFTFSLKKSNISTSESYEIYAEFDNTEGVGAGSDIKISGVKIGTIVEQKLNNKNYRATLKLNIYQNIKLPKDSSAKIASSGLLGGKYLSIEPGAEDDLLQNGDEIGFTQSSLSLEDMLGKFIFGSKKEEAK